MTAMEWIKTLGYNQVVFELDCENVTKSLNSDDLQAHWVNQNLVISVKEQF